MLTASAGSGRGSDNNPDHVTEAQALAALDYLIGLGLDLNATNEEGDSVMHVASTTNLGSPAVIQFLHGKGARVNVKNKAGRTPLKPSCADAGQRRRHRCAAEAAIGSHYELMFSKGEGHMRDRRWGYSLLATGSVHRAGAGCAGAHRPDEGAKAPRRSRSDRKGTRRDRVAWLRGRASTSRVH